MKKIITIFILIVLISSMFAVEGFAAVYSDVSNNEKSQMLEILSAYNILSGYSDGTFRPGNCVTRAEIAKIATMLIGYDEFSKGMTSTFTDMKGHWAERYVEIINELGILTGYENNTYEPEKYITYTETVVVILKILGYNDSVLEDNYPENYHNLAKNLGLLKNINNPSVYMTRESLATLIYNALFVNTVSIKNNAITNNNKQLISNIGKKEKVKIDDKFALKHPYMDLNEYMLNTYDVYYDIHGKIILIKNPVYKSVDGYAKSSLSTNVVFLNDSLGNTNLYSLSDVPVVFNGIQSEVTNDDLKNSKIKLILDNSNPDIVIGAVVVKVTDEIVIDADSVYKKGDVSFAGKFLPSNGDEILFDHIKVTGAANSIYDIQADDVVYFYETNEKDGSKSTLTMRVVRNSVSGVYNGKGNINYESFFTIDITSHKLSDKLNLTEELSSGDKIKAVLDENNKIIKANILKYAKEPETYAMIVEVSKETNSLPTVKLLNKQGKTITYTLRENCGEVIKSTENGEAVYSTSLAANNFVKYDKFDDENIKIIKKISSVNIASNYNNATGELVSQNAHINSGTLVVQLIDGKYNKINKSSLGYYLEGKAIINSDRTAEIFILEKNMIKTEDTPAVDPSIGGEKPPAEKPPLSTLTGSLYGAIETIVSNNSVETVKLYNSVNAYTVSKTLDKTLKNYKNKFVKLTIKDNIVTDIASYSPEISKSKVTAIYNGQLQIDGISYVEYSSSVLVYTCTYDSSGNITSFKSSAVSDIKINSSVQFYNINKNYNGVMDVMIIYN